MHGGEAAQFVPYLLGRRCSPVVSQRGGHSTDDGGVGAGLSGGSQRRPDSLNPPFARGNCPLGLAPVGGGRKHHIGHLGGAGQEDVLHHHEFQSLQEVASSLDVGFGVGGVLSDHIDAAQQPLFHGLEHLGQVKPFARRDRSAPRCLERSAQPGGLHILEPGQLVGNGAHVAASLHVVLAAQRHQPRSIAPHMTAEQRQVDEGQDVVGGVVMFSDSQSPAQLSPFSLRIGMGQGPDGVGGHSRHLFSPFQGPFLHAGRVGLEIECGSFDEPAVLQARRKNLPGHGIGQGDVRSHVESQPQVGPSGGLAVPGIDAEKARPAADRPDNPVEENRMSGPGVGSPQDHHLGVIHLLVGTGSPPGSEDRRQTGDAGSVSGSVAGIYVVGAHHHPSELLCQIVGLVGGF